VAVESLRSRMGWQSEEEEATLFVREGIPLLSGLQAWVVSRQSKSCSVALHAATRTAAPK